MIIKIMKKGIWKKYSIEARSLDKYKKKYGKNLIVIHDGGTML